jgi:hypothetical protein
MDDEKSSSNNEQEINNKCPSVVVVVENTTEVPASSSITSTNEDNDEDIIHKKKRRFVLFNESDDSGDSSHIESDSESKRVKSDEINVAVEAITAALPSVVKTEDSDQQQQQPAADISSTSSTKRSKVKPKRPEATSKQENETNKFDTSDPDYWDRVYKCNKFNTLKFKDLLNRECGQIRPKVFQDKAINNLDYIRRLKLSKSLKFHEGCVNALNFNRIGTLLCSGSDDYQICIYDWARSRAILNFDSGHKSNVFQVSDCWSDF